MDTKQIKELMKEFDNSQLTYLEITQNETLVKMKKQKQIIMQPAQNTAVGLPPVAAKPQPTAVEKQNDNQAQEQSNKTQVKAPLVGVYYKASSPQAKPFVNVGDTVKKGDIIFLIEAMKVINEIKAPVSGTVNCILVNDGDLLSFGDVVMEIE